MKSRLVIALCVIAGLLMGTSQAFASGAAVQTAVSNLVNGGAGSTGDTVTFNSSIGAGHVIACGVRNGQSANVSFNIATDTAGNTWTFSATGTFATANASFADFYTTNTVAFNGSDTVRLMWTGTGLQSNDQLGCIEISGLSGALDTATNTQQGTASASATIGPTAVTTNANDYIVSIITSYGANGNTWSAGTGYALETPASTARLAIVDKNVSATGAQSAPFNMGASLRYGGEIWAFPISASTTVTSYDPFLLADNF